MFGYVSRRKVERLVRAYEHLLRLHDFRYSHPRDWLTVSGLIGNLREELGIHPGKDTREP